MISFVLVLLILCEKAYIFLFIFNSFLKIIISEMKKSYIEVIEMDFIPNQKVIKVNREKVVKGLTGGRLYLVAY